MNPFDEFDTPKPQQAVAVQKNPFDEFDAPQTLRTGVSTDSNLPAYASLPLDFVKGFAQEGLAQSTFQGYNAPKPQNMAEGVGQFAGNIGGGVANTLTGSAVGAGLGGLVGLMGGPFAGITVPAGMAGGAALGGLAGNFLGGAAAQYDQYRNEGKPTNPYAVALSGAASAAGPMLGRAITKAGAPVLRRLATDAALGALLSGGTDAGIQLSESGRIDPVRAAQMAAVGAGLGGGAALLPALGGRLKRDYQMMNRRKFSPRPTVPDPVPPKKALEIKKVLVKGLLPQKEVSAQIVPRSQPAQGPLTPTRFANVTASESPMTSPDVAQALQANAPVAPTTTNQGRIEQAKKNLAENYNDVLARLSDEADISDQTAVDGEVLASSLQEQGRFEEAIQVISQLSEKFRKAGQTVQAAAIWNKLTPDGAVYAAAKVAKKRGVKLSEETAKAVYAMGKRIEQAKDNVERKLLGAQLLVMINRAAPKTLGKKISTVQTMSQLLAPKTAERNLIGNQLFGTAENFSDVIATVADAFLSIITKKRTKVLPQTKAALSRGYRGALQGVGDVAQGIDTSGGNSKWDVQRVPTFEKGPLNFLEKVMGVELSASDRMYYEATYGESIMNQLKAAKKTQKINKTFPLYKRKVMKLNGYREVRITPKMRETAHAEALYRTFQDDNKLSDAMVALKKGMNKIGIKDFGLGDLVLKYPKTPSNIMMRGMDYSPVQLGFLMRDLYGAMRGKEFNQRDFVQRFGRFTTGSLGLGAGYYLRKLNVVTAKPDENKDVANAKRQEGESRYQINASAIRRLFASGMNPAAAAPKEGDTLVSYDWAQPSAIALSAGISLADAEGTNNEKLAVDNAGQVVQNTLGAAGEAAKAAVAGANTLVDQPLLQGITKLTSPYNDGLTQGLADAGLEAPVGFVPQLVGSAAKRIDNTKRDTYDPNPIKEAGNKLIAKTPFASKMLPEQRDIYGEPTEHYQGGSNTTFNVFFNPAFVAKAKKDPITSKILDLYQQTGETGQIPNMVGRNVSISRNGSTVQVQLTAQQRSNYQRIMGRTTRRVLEQMAQDPRFEMIPVDRQVDEMKKYVSAVNTATKIYLFGHRPTKRNAMAEYFYQMIASEESASAQKDAKKK